MINKSKIKIQMTQNNSGGYINSQYDELLNYGGLRSLRDNINVFDIDGAIPNPHKNVSSL